MLPVANCEWGLEPLEEQALSAAEKKGRLPRRYRKLAWWLVSPGLYLYALLLARVCRGAAAHVHVSVEGPSCTPGVKRTKEAGQYASELCKAWAVVLRAAYHGWSPGRIKQAMPSLVAAGADLGGLAQVVRRELAGAPRQLTPRTP